MDTAQLSERLRETVQTLHCLRVSSGPKEPKACWPEPIADFWTAYGSTAAFVRRPVPGSEHIDRMDECLAWLSAFRRLPSPDEPERILLCRILWARGAMFSWEAIADQLRAHGHKTSGSTIKRRHEVAMAVLLGIANQTAAEREAA